MDVEQKTISIFKVTLTDIFANVAKMSDDDEKQDYLTTLQEQDLDFLEDYLNFKPYLYNIWNVQAVHRKPFTRGAGQTLSPGIAVKLFHQGRVI